MGLRHKPVDCLLALRLVLPNRSALCIGHPLRADGLPNPALTHVDEATVASWLQALDGADVHSDVAVDISKHGVLRAAASSADSPGVRALVRQSIEAVEPEALSSGDSLLEVANQVAGYLVKISPDWPFVSDTKYFMLYGQACNGLKLDKKGGEARGSKLCKGLHELRRQLKEVTYRRARLQPRKSDVDFQPGETISDDVATGPVIDRMTLLTDSQVDDMLQDGSGPVGTAITYFTANGLDTPVKLHVGSVMSLNKVMMQLMQHVSTITMTVEQVAELVFTEAMA